jgi:hypothetical protein
MLDLSRPNRAAIRRTPTCRANMNSISARCGNCNTCSERPAWAAHVGLHRLDSGCATKRPEEGLPYAHATRASWKLSAGRPRALLAVRRSPSRQRRGRSDLDAALEFAPGQNRRLPGDAVYEAALRDAPPAAAGRIESTAEVDRGGPGAGYSSAEGRAGKKRLRPAVKRAMVAEVTTTHALSQRRACGLIGIARRGLKRAPVEDRNRGLRQRLRELAQTRRRWGCPLLYLMLRREGWRANHKRGRATISRRRAVLAQTAPAQAADPSARGTRRPEIWPCDYSAACLAPWPSSRRYDPPLFRRRGTTLSSDRGV